MEGTFSRLGARMREMGVTVSVWDADCHIVGEFDWGSEFCRLLSEAGCDCREAMRETAARIISEAHSVTSRTQSGCCLFGVPVRLRRRLLGAVVAGYPPRDLADDERLARLCHARQLDGQHMSGCAKLACRHGADEVDDLLRILDWMLQGEQALDTATSELDNLSGNLATTYEELSLLYRISGSMRVTQCPERFLEDVCRELFEVMHIESAAAVVYAHPPSAEEDIVVVAGKPPMDDRAIMRLASTALAPKFGSDNRPVLDNSFPDGPVRSMVAMPLVVEDELLGMLIGFNKTTGDFVSVDLKLINSVGNQSSVFLANSKLYAELQDLLMGVLHALTASIDAKDPYTCGHSQRVALVSKRLAEDCGFDPERVHRVYLAGLLHDIGKIGVPESILCKPGKLTDEEYSVIKRHPVMGAKILGGIRQLDDVVVGILNHHERPDGKGYPDGLKGAEVPIEGLMVGLGDCFDSMTSDRTYRQALSMETVVDEIRRHAGTQFDVGLVEKLLSWNLAAFMEELHQPTRSVFPFGADLEKAHEHNG